MRRRAAIGVASAIVVVVVFARVFLHATAAPSPALIAAATDVHRAVGTTLDARIDRLLHDRSDGTRSDRPKLVALTFDDGPYPVTTPLLLATLHDLGVHATFFVIGRDVEQFPALTRQIGAEGHELANHTATHPNLDRLDAAGVRMELANGAALIGDAAPDPSERRYFRPPHGRFTEETLRIAQAAGYTTVLWNDDPGDWRTTPAEVVSRHLFAHATAPDIVLLHSGKLSTIAMLPEVVRGFRDAGFSFVTVRELLARAPPEQVIHPERHPIVPRS